MLTIGVLGPVEARLDGSTLPLPAGKTTELLARLALNVGEPVRVDVLVEDLWREPTARNTLQSKVSQLRRAIGTEHVRASGDGYRLVLPPESVDAFQVATLTAASAAARAANDISAILASARAGLALFRGDPLAGLGDWAAPHRARLEELRLTLLEHAAAARVDLGAGGEIVAELESLIDEHPLREGLWAVLITALYRSGRQADALAAYGRLRRLLIDELGVEPGPSLRLLEQQILRQHPTLGTGDVRPLTPPGNLPPLPGPTIGRDGDVATVLAAVADRRLVTILGPGGVGKTRLALEVAHRLDPPAGGTWLIRLDGVDAAADLSQIVAEALSAVGGERALRERLAGAPTVLVLDNCEHLVASAADLVESVLDHVPKITVLATSQAPLGLADEDLHDLAPLSQEHSVALFTERARRRGRRLVPDTETTTAIQEICRSLDGLPLAIELAAARARSLSVRDIARRLDDRFALLRDPSSARPERRRALAGAIAWSYDLLFPDDQRALWALSCFVGSAPLGGVEQVLTALDVPAPAVADTIGRLVDRSLVSVEDGPADEVRYRLLDSIRLYAADRLRESGQASAAFAAHAAWYAQTAARCQAHIRGDHQLACLAVARTERANVDAALAWCATHDPALGGRIAVDLGWTWVVLGDGTEGASRIRNALAADWAPSGQLPAGDVVTGRLLVAWLEASAGNVAIAQDDLDQARELAVQLGDDVLLADADRHQAFVAIQEGRPQLARSAAVASLAVYRAHGLDWSVAAGLLLGAYGSLMLGDTVTAGRDATAALGVLAPLGDSWGQMHAQAMLGAIAQAEHRFDDAASTLQHAADRSAALGFLGQAALHRATLARIQHRAGDPRAAGSYLRALEAAAVCGDGRVAATARVNLARYRRALGDRDGALTLLEENEQWYAAAGGGDFALLNSCLLAAARDDRVGLTAVLAQARAVSDGEATVHALDALARLAAEAGDLPASRSLLAAADAAAAAVSHLLDPADRVDGSRARSILAS